MAYGKRSMQQAEEMVWLPDGTDMARFMLLFSGHHHGGSAAADTTSAPEKVFECKTCKRRFPSFQALGGHRASHKKPRLADGDGAAEQPKPKVHSCSICGLQFAIGQALGGHMRRHRAAVEAEDLGLGLSLGVRPQDDVKKTAPPAELVLDLNFPALEEEPDRAKLGLSDELPIAVDFLLR